MRGLTVNRDVGINSTLPRVFGLEGLVGCSVGRVWCFSLATCISLRFPKVVLIQVFLHIMIFDGDTGAIFQVSESFEIVPVPPSSIPAAPERPRSTRCHDRGSLPIIANLDAFHCSLGYNRIIFTYR